MPCSLNLHGFHLPLQSHVRVCNIPHCHQNERSNAVFLLPLTVTFISFHPAFIRMFRNFHPQPIRFQFPPIRLAGVKPFASVHPEPGSLSAWQISYHFNYVGYSAAPPCKHLLNVRTRCRAFYIPFVPLTHIWKYLCPQHYQNPNRYSVSKVHF